MKSIALAIIVATLAGCAIVPVPIGPTVVIGGRASYGDGGYYGRGGYRGGYYGGGGWRR